MAAAKEASRKEGLKVSGWKVVNDGSEGVVPPGCSYSHISKTAVFNRHPNAGFGGKYSLVCVAEAAERLSIAQTKVTMDEFARRVAAHRANHAGNEQSR